LPRRHPLHPPLVHAPLGLLSTAPLWDLLALWQPGPTWAALAFWNLALGLALALVAACAGLVDAQAVREPEASRRLSAHTLLMLAAVAVFGASLAWRAGPLPPTGLAAWGVLAVDGAGALLLLVGGWHGGELVYRHGVGRMP
jgi:uncharacterized membrane protein